MQTFHDWLDPNFLQILTKVDFLSICLLDEAFKLRQMIDYTYKLLSGESNTVQRPFKNKPFSVYMLDSREFGNKNFKNKRKRIANYNFSLLKLTYLLNSKINRSSCIY